MKKLFTIMLIFLCFTSLEAKKIDLSIDAASFRYDDNNSLWELYYSFPDSALKFIKNNDSYLGEMYFEIKIESAAGIEVEHNWIVAHQVDSLEKIGLLLLTGQKSFVLKTGQYKAIIKVSDLADTSTNSDISFDLIIKGYQAKNLGISDIQFAYYIEPVELATQNWKDMFKKNSLYVIPNPSLEFIGTKPDVNVYFEIYNAKSLSPNGVNLYYSIIDALNKEVFGFARFKESVADGIVENISIPLDALSTGIYFLKITCKSSEESSSDSVTTFKKFYLNNPDIPPSSQIYYTENESFESSEFAALTSERTDIELRQAMIIATDEEESQADMLSDLKAQQRFLYRFWLIRDPNATTRYNERRMDFLSAIEYANTYFKYGNFKEGWRTERGRVLLKYGFPTQTDRVAAQGDNRPYETWFYAELRGGTNFYFVDMHGFGNYILVHSTMIGEPRDDLWFEHYVTSHDYDDVQKSNTINRNTYR